jgi:predicted ribosome-associated RNA-binding protein Tma20
MKSSYHINRKIVDKLVKKYQQYKESIQEGTKVKLNVKAIQSDRNYSRMTDQYKAFVEEHKDTIFTVEYDEKFGKEPKIVMLKEDISDPKYYWWIGELEVL